MDVLGGDAIGEGRIRRCNWFIEARSDTKGAAGAGVSSQGQGLQLVLEAVLEEDAVQFHDYARHPHRERQTGVAALNRGRR